MNEIRPFQFSDGVTVRTVVIDGEPHFVGKDVADALGYANASKAMGDHCKGVTKRYPLQTGGGLQEARVLTEPDMMRLIVNSTLPAAQRFECWVFEEVLPTIRKTGQYTAPARALSPAELLHAQTGLLVDMERRQSAQQEAIEHVQTRVEEVAASVSFLRERPQNAEAISHIKPRMLRAYGIPGHVVELCMRQLPYSPKPAGMVRQEREEAHGAAYAVFWTKDVNTLFRRFVGECTRVTDHFVTHPDVEERFRLRPGAEGSAST